MEMPAWGTSSVRRWVKHFKDWNTDIAYQPRCGRPRTAATERNKQKVDELIRRDLGITVRGTTGQLGVGTTQSRRWWRFWDIGKFVPVGFLVCLRVQRNTKRLGTALPSIQQSGFGPVRLPLTCSGPWKITWEVTIMRLTRQFRKPCEAICEELEWTSTAEAPDPIDCSFFSSILIIFSYTFYQGAG
jgi:hypothetical protein